MNSIGCNFFFFSSRRRHTRSKRDWSSDVCSSDLAGYSRSSGSVPLHAARVVQSVIHMCPLLLIVEREYPAVVSMGLRSRGECVRPLCHGYLFVIQQLTERSEERRVGKEWRSRWST